MIKELSLVIELALFGFASLGMWRSYSLMLAGGNKTVLDLIILLISGVILLSFALDGIEGVKK